MKFALVEALFDLLLFSEVKPPWESLGLLVSVGRRSPLCGKLLHPRRRGSKRTSTVRYTPNTVRLLHAVPCVSLFFCHTFVDTIRPSFSDSDPTEKKNLTPWLPRGWNVVSSRHTCPIEEQRIRARTNCPMPLRPKMALHLGTDQQWPGTYLHNTKISTNFTRWNSLEEWKFYMSI